MTAPLTREERPRRDEEPQLEGSWPRATRTARKRHPCPTCGATGAIRRSFGCAYPGDLNSEAYAILPCETCKGTGARPKILAEISWKDGRPTVTHQIPPEGELVVNGQTTGITNREFEDFGKVTYFDEVGEFPPKDPKVTALIAQASAILRGEDSPTIVSLEGFKVLLGLAIPPLKLTIQLPPGADEDALGALGWFPKAKPHTERPQPQPEGRHFL